MDSFVAVAIVRRRRPERPWTGMWCKWRRCKTLSSAHFFFTSFFLFFCEQIKIEWRKRSGALTLCVDHSRILWKNKIFSVSSRTNSETHRRERKNDSGKCMPSTHTHTRPITCVFFVRNFIWTNNLRYVHTRSACMVARACVYSFLCASASFFLFTVSTNSRCAFVVIGVRACTSADLQARSVFCALL